VVLVVRHALLQHAFAAAVLVPLVPAQRAGRFLSSACALTPVCGSSALSLSQAVWSAIFCHRHGGFITLLGSISGHTSARSNFHFAVPFIHSISPDDRDVGSEDGHPAADPHYGELPEIESVLRAEGAHAMIKTPYGHKVYAMAAEYPSAAALYEAAKRVRDAGFRRWDVYSPFPIHGMDGAMGIGKSWLKRLGSVWRNFGIPDRGARRIWPVINSVPA